MRERKFSRKRLGICAGTILVAAVLLIPGFWQKNTYGKDKESTVQQKEETAAGEDAVRDGEDNEVESAAVEKLEIKYAIDTEKPGKDSTDSKVESAAGGQEAQPEHTIDAENPDKDSAGSMTENTAVERPETEYYLEPENSDGDAVERVENTSGIGIEFGYPTGYYTYEGSQE